MPKCRQLRLPETNAHGHTYFPAKLKEVIITQKLTVNDANRFLPLANFHVQPDDSLSLRQFEWSIDSLAVLFVESREVEHCSAEWLLAERDQFVLFEQSTVSV